MVIFSKQVEIAEINILPSSFESCMNRIDQNYKNHKMGRWRLSALKMPGYYLLQANSLDRSIGTWVGTGREYMKVMKIETVPHGTGILLKKTYGYRLEDFICVPFMNWFLPLMAVGLILIQIGLRTAGIELNHSGTLNSLIGSLTCGMPFLAILQRLWTRNTKELEKERLQVIADVLKKELTKGTESNT